ncbi:hypothetical protein Q3G72_025111 [Acer saccharum]|nr:hypothetical protein Q3G72_025111 [Acer saccharum]
MEITVKSIAVSIVVVAVVTWAWRVVNWVWLRPKKMEKYLRQQGLSGNSYSCNDMITKWDQKLIMSSSSSCELDVWPYLVSLTSDVISRTAFGSNFEQGKRIFQLQTELAALTMQVLQSVCIPGWR